ncbi:hypothetical protein DOTSEDRAFT_70221 [Dothistroma septosporum NZE10]|uniref:Glycoside hydrolase family 31 protein n=1 Tax=Dothistroma septosporum (strain NZE10 / CBS 128990) TaxID=675120 RepID=N1PRZ8_DOTSN|nr:hypothetical protein DOTSEDRAFT_70221 [Dothistroma septosporum NZE10]
MMLTLWSSPNFDPGGWLYPPTEYSDQRLNLRIKPRYTIYDSSERSAEFIVDAQLSYTHGESYLLPSSKTKDDHYLDIRINLVEEEKVLIEEKLLINSSSSLFNFELRDLKARLDPYAIELHAQVPGPKGRTYHADTELYFLPAKNNGSTVKIDNLYGGMMVANNVTKYGFEPLLPFGFYTSCDGYLNYSLTNVSAYKNLGFNAINPVCAFAEGDLDYMFDWLDMENLWFQYDMRDSYLNLSSVAEQIPLVKHRSSFLSWYTADEPDGWQYNLSSTKAAYDLLKKEDPYHPTGLVLNCNNYYFEEYSSGTDYIMEDAYPVGIDPTFSRKFNTTCNETYGDCGCDDCKGSLLDVSDRLNTFSEYQGWLGTREKPLWSVLQAFFGEKYWARSPTPAETWVMMILSFNHKAKAIMSWTFPTTPVSLGAAHGRMAKVVSQSPVRDFLIGDDPKAIEVESHPLLDVAYWTIGKELMVSVANVETDDSKTSLTIELPVKVHSITGQPWGSSSWHLDEGGRLCTSGLGGLTSSIVTLHM